MRYHEIINELRGIKTHTNNPDVNRNSLSWYMQNLGFEILSSGYFSYVFQDPTNSNRVIKIFNDDSYEDYIKFCKARPTNPHLPRFKGNPVLLKNLPKFQQKMGNKAAKMIRMEKLNEPTNDDWFKVAYIVQYLVGKKLDKKYVDEIEDASLIETINEIKQFGYEHGHNLDWQIQNIMCRGDVIVFIDPYYVNRET